VPNEQKLTDEVPVFVVGTFFPLYQFAFANLNVILNLSLYSASYVPAHKNYTKVDFSVNLPVFIGLSRSLITILQ
jgi:hypothetical protein